MALAFLDDPHRDFVDCLPKVDLRKHFEIVRELGRGRYAKVVLVRRRESDELFAAKMVRLEQSPESTSPTSETASSSMSTNVHNRRARDQFQFELTLAYFLSPCPYIIRTQSDAFRTNHHMIALMEPALGGDLASKLRDPRTRIGEQQLKAVAIQLASAIQFIHERSLVHGDIRPENVLLVDQSLSVVKLGDFSRTKKSGSMVRYGTVMMSQRSGSISQKPFASSHMIASSHSSTGSDQTSASRRGSSANFSDVSYPGQINGADAYSPPEIVDLSPSDFYTVHPSQDVWGYGLVLFCLSIERIPSWLICSCKTDPVFADFIEALNAAVPGHVSASATLSDLHSPAAVSGTLTFYQQALSRLTSSFITLLRGTLEIDSSNRAQIKTVRNYTLSRWLTLDAKPSSLGSVALPSQKGHSARGAAGRSTPAISTSMNIKALTSQFARSKMTGSSSIIGSQSAAIGTISKAQSETALHDLGGTLTEGQLAHITEGVAGPLGTSSPSTSFSADGSSAGDPASPKVTQPTDSTSNVSSILHENGMAKLVTDKNWTAQTDITHYV